MLDISNHKIIKYKSPVNLLIIENFFVKEVNNEILLEIGKNKNGFIQAEVSNKNKIDKKIRTNTVLYMDLFYKNKRDGSVLLKNIDSALKNDYIHQLLINMPPPICDLPTTNYAETQVSRYGNSEQKYDWHVDRMGTNQRWITMVYYVFKEPKKFTGGNICFTDAVNFNSVLLKQTPKPEILEIEPKNNMAVFLGSRTLHMVKPTTSPKKFIDGRFSVNCWIGYV